jgi:hypothetical protein
MRVLKTFFRCFIASLFKFSSHDKPFGGP